MNKQAIINELINNLQKCDEDLRILCLFYNSNCEGCKDKLNVNSDSGCVRKDIQELIDKFKKEKEG